MPSQKAGFTGSTRRSHAAAWTEYAMDLANWTQYNMIIRYDGYGAYYSTRDGSVKPYTYKRSRISLTRLERHYRATRAEDIVGLHVATKDERCWWFAADIDRHKDSDDPGANWRYALHLLGSCLEHGLDVLLIDSNGKGGYHLLGLFDGPVPMRKAYLLGKYLQRDWRQFGFPRQPEWFPKSAAQTTELGFCGGWLRLPGRHHKRDHWSRVWDPQREKWLAGEAAIASILKVRGLPVELDLLAPEPPPPEPKLARRSVERRTHRRVRQDVVSDPARELALACKALEYLDPDMHHDDWIEVAMALKDLGAKIGDDEVARDLFDSWSRRSESKYDEFSLLYKWESLRPGDECEGRGITIATLYRRAMDGGWLGPAYHGIEYPRDFRDRPGPILIACSEADYRLLIAVGAACLWMSSGNGVIRRLARLIGRDDRPISVFVANGEEERAGAIAQHLERLIGRRVTIRRLTGDALPIMRRRAPGD